MINLPFVFLHNQALKCFHGCKVLIHLIEHQDVQRVGESSEAYCDTMKLITCGWKPDSKQIKIILLLAMRVYLKQMYSRKIK